MTMIHRAAISFLMLVSLSGTASADFATQPPDGEVFHIDAKLKTPKKSRDKRAGEPDIAPFSLFVPENTKTIRGVVFNPFYAKTVEQKHWRTAVDHWDFALMGANMFGVRKDEVRETIESALKQLAQSTKYPELAHAPLCLVGMSAGGGMSVSITAAIPERIIAAAPVCLEVGPRNEASYNVPIVTIFGERDGKQLEKLTAKLPTRRAAGAQWAIAVQWGRKHEFHRANNLIFPWFDHVIQARYPVDLDPTNGQPKLKPIPTPTSWLGESAKWGDHPVRIYAESARRIPDVSQMCWLPNAYVAHVWQAFVVRKPKIRITSPPGLGGGQPFLLHAADKPIEVKVALDKSTKFEKLTIHDGDEPLTEGDGAQTEFRIPTLKPGIHALIVEGTDASGNTHLSAPHTILVRANR